MKTQFRGLNGWCAAGVLLVLLSSVPTEASEAPPLVLIPGGTFEMGDHFGFVDPKHGGDETPVHKVRVDSFHMGAYDITTGEYCAFLNDALSKEMVEVRQGGVYIRAGQDLLCETRVMSPYSRIAWSGGKFAVLDGKEKHPIVCIRWAGAAAYCNWLSARAGYPACYDTSTWDCDLNKSGYRLPTEAEWEYAARGGLKAPYRNFPWGDDPDAFKANWPESKNPFRAGPQPWTTPVGFFNGQLYCKSDLGWPGPQETFQTFNGVNGYGLFDMTGNVWQFINDWYGRDYYAYSPTNNPPGPVSGSLMPDGKTYRGMRGGNWYNGENGHGRVSNRNPSYFRGPQDPDHPYYHLGFRVVRPVDAESRPVIRPTPVQEVRGRQGPPEGAPGGGRPPRPQTSAREGDLRPGDSRPSEPVASSASLRKPYAGFALHSPLVADGGALPAEFTGDGAAVTLPLEWSGEPEGTRSYALIMHHEAPDQTKWYWILYSIPADVHGLPKNVKGLGTLGNNSVNRRLEYAPPQSKGPGPKTYTYTLYALSAPPQITVTPVQVNREVLLGAMKDQLLATAELNVTYTRPEGGNEGIDHPRPPPGRTGKGPSPKDAPGGNRKP